MKNKGYVKVVGSQEHNDLMNQEETDKDMADNKSIIINSSSSSSSFILPKV